MLRPHCCKRLHLHLYRHPLPRSKPSSQTRSTLWPLTTFPTPSPHLCIEGFLHSCQLFQAWNQLLPVLRTPGTAGSNVRQVAVGQPLRLPGTTASNARQVAVGQPLRTAGTIGSNT
eukprot:356357-Chlamydomonas_euryale.AAC.1